MEKRYFLKSAWRTNLDTFHTKCQVIIYGFEADEYKEYDGKDYYYWLDRHEEILKLIDNSWDGKACGKDYNRIHELSDERNLMRYITNINNGMDEDKASKSFL
jgi:hypothetical protein